MIATVVLFILMLVASIISMRMDDKVESASLMISRLVGVLTTWGFFTLFMGQTVLNLVITVISIVWFIVYIIIYHKKLDLKSLLFNYFFLLAFTAILAGISYLLTYV